MNTREPLIIALDMDGTLLNNKKKISIKTLFYLRKLTKQGHKIVLCSGRPIRALETYYKKLNLNTPMICYNGSYSFSPSDANFKGNDLKYSKDIVLNLFNGLKEKALGIMCETDDEIWIDKEDKFLDNFFWYKGMTIHKGDINKTLDKAVKTCIVHVPDNYRKVDEIETILSKHKDISYIYWIGVPYFELCHKNVSKGSALKTIADYYKIPKENIIAIGDSTNDIEMFDLAGYSILMKNSKKTIKNATTISSRDNNHDGIYYALKDILK